MKILVEVEIQPKHGWRVFNAAEVELAEGVTYITDAPEDHLVTPNEDYYSRQLFEKDWMAKELGGWVRDGIHYGSEQAVEARKIRHFKNVGSI